MNQTAAMLLSIAMLAAFVLAGFGARIAWQGANRKQGVLMIVAGVVLAANVLVLTV